MCLRKLFPNWFKPDPPPVVINSKRKALLFAINDYPGNDNDLNGCINDQSDMEKKLMALFPDFYIKKFQDSEVTRNRFITEVRQAINTLKPGDVLLIHYSGHGTQVYDRSGDEEDGYDEALYLYDGSVIDDDIGAELKSIPDGATVVIMLDSCFSGTATKALGAKECSVKFVPTPGLPLRHKKRVRLNKEELNYIVISGCREDQTSADAFINGRFNGAFTFYAVRNLISIKLIYTAWFKEMLEDFESSPFDQVPTLEGKETLLNRELFT